MSGVYEQIMAKAGWEPRPQQAALVAHLREAAASRRQVITQAGTGVGKTLAVLSTAAEVGKPGNPVVVMIHTNALARQYVGNDAAAVTELTNARIARVIGANYYVCASSPAALADGVPQEASTEFEVDAVTRERAEWLDGQVSGAPWATYWERRPDHSDSYRCPGWPDCAGMLLRGCGKRLARERGRVDAHVVVTNYHLAVIQALLPALPLLPAPAKRALTVIDEAHGLPDVVASILSCQIGPRFGNGAFQISEEMDDEQRDAVNRLRAWLASLRAARLDNAIWDAHDHWQRERRVRLLSPAQAPAVINAVELYAATRPDNDEDTAAGDGHEGLSVLDGLRLLAASATDSTIVPTIHRPEPNGHNPGPDARPDTIYLRRADVSAFLGGMLDGPAALISGTIPPNLAARVGLPDVVPVDVGHPFDYANQVRGWLSRHDGGKSINSRWSKADRDRLFILRVAELGRFLGEARGLVLTPSHDDVARLLRALPATLPAGVHLFAQPRYGGSEAAMEVVAAFRAHAGPAVLLGTDSYSTGLDLPGELLTRVAWWSLPLGSSTPVDAQRQLMYPGRVAAGVTVPAGGAPHGSYYDDRLRVKVVQGVGRLIRTASDIGEVLLCDRRFRDHLTGSSTILDAHLRVIPWDWAD